jgi:hypothetical protein
MAHASENPWLQAYSGAMEVVKAKHAFWPPSKLEFLKLGLPLLDSAVAQAPDNAEIRYVRLTSNYYLPFFLGRKDTVQVDMAALGKSLAAARSQFRPLWFAAMARFLLENGKLHPEDRKTLREAWEKAKAEGNQKELQVSEKASPSLEIP